LFSIFGDENSSTVGSGTRKLMKKNKDLGIVSGGGGVSHNSKKSTQGETMADRKHKLTK
jgi:hypothetical protein